MENNSLDEEYRRLLRRGDEEERERLRAEREAHEPESEPEPVLREPTDEEPITVAAAAWLLHARYIRPLETKPDDSAIHRELIKNHKGLERRELEELILRWGREGLIDLIDPILEISFARSPDPHRYWLIGPKAFETVRNKLANAHELAVNDATVPPNEADGDDLKDAAPNKRGPVNKKRAEATARMVEAVRTGEVTASQLQGMKQKELENLYRDAKRTTLEEARKEALFILRQNSDKTPTNDK